MNSQRNLKIIALFNKNDKYHEKIKKFIMAHNGILTTGWPVITEVCHILDFNINTQIDSLKWIKSGVLRIKDIRSIEINRIIFHYFQVIPFRRYIK